MKGLTQIPFAKEAAALMVYPEAYASDYGNPQPGFWARVYHFENRYWSIDQLLEGADTPNILELSSGFNFRGLAMAQDKPVYYIDTDLPELIRTKQQFIQSLSRDLPPPKGKLEVLPLNALDGQAFKAILSRFPPGRLSIVNEGLLMYLGRAEKEALCRLIHEALSERGGYWITADAYIRAPLIDKALEQTDKLEQFFEEHRIEENKFASFEEASAFFSEMGFAIDKEAGPDYARMTALPHLVRTAGPELMGKMQRAGKIHATWRLRAV